CLTPDAPAASPPRPPKIGPVAPGSGSAATGSGRAVKLPSRQQAERIARDLAGRAGIGLDGASVRVVAGYRQWLVTIAPTVGGLPTAGLVTTVSVGSGGAVEAASGWLAAPRPADSYPLIGVAEGVKRLQRQVTVGPPFVRAELGKGRPPADSRVSREVTVTGVRLGLQQAAVAATGNHPAGVAYLLPAYLFELRGDWLPVRSVIAVQDRYLTPPPSTVVPQGRPRGTPTP
ncbi:MAG TPA: hypothetical protein VFD04_23210, partial [Actinomycetes bacterium]|nr:hypothetical protein [Actinomycetes bacterium]